MPRDDITDMSGLIIGPVFNIHFWDSTPTASNLFPQLPDRSRIEMISILI